MISERTYDMYRSPTIRMGYSTRLQCIGQSAWVGDTNAYRILVGIPDQKQSNRKDRRALWRWVESDSRSNEIADFGEQVLLPNSKLLCQKDTEFVTLTVLFVA